MRLRREPNKENHVVPDKPTGEEEGQNEVTKPSFDPTHTILPTHFNKYNSVGKQVALLAGKT
jgi:hypothetical protein